MSQPINTHILAHDFAYHEPVTLASASELLLRAGAQIVAGGTDALVHMKTERSAPAHLVSLRRVPGLRGVSADHEGVTIGATTTIAEIAAHPLVRAHYLALAEACDSFSTAQVATMGTVGGNIANSSPAADTAPALLAFGASVVICGPDGERRLPIAEFFVGPGRSALARGEIVTAVSLPRPATQGLTSVRTKNGSAFLKMGRVSADIAKASAAAILMRDGDCIVEARLAFGSVGPTPLRAPRAEALLRGQRYAVELVAQAAELAAQEISPIDDVRSQAWYRREIVRVMALDGLQRAWMRAGQPARVWDEAGAARGRDVATEDEGGAVPGRAVTGRENPPLHEMTLEAGQERAVTLRVNGRSERVWVAANELLLNVLREKLHLTGSKYGCGIGECSACTVLMDGKPVLACLALAVAAEGHEIQTVEGLQAPDGALDPLQEAFIDLAGYQCGYCTPGMLMTAKSLLVENPHPTEDDVRHYLRGNLCRCTGYVSIARAVLAAASGMNEAVTGAPPRGGAKPSVPEPFRGHNASRI